MEWLRTTFELTSTQTNAIESVLVIVVMLLLRAAIRRYTRTKVEDPDLSYRIRKTSGYVIAGLTLLFLVLVWLEPLGEVGTFLGLASAGIAIALSDLLKNIAGWFYVVTRRPFKVDDRIEVAGLAGDVIDIRLFRTTMLEIRNWVDADQSTGRLLHVPNGTFLNSTVHNSTEGFDFLWHEIAVMVTFESDWRRAEQLIHDILHRLTDEVCDRARKQIRHASRDYKIRYTHFTPTVYVDVKDSGVVLTGRMLVPVRQRRSFHQQAWRAILDAFDEHDRIDLAYPTIRTYVPPADRRPVGEGSREQRLDLPGEPVRDDPGSADDRDALR